MVLHKDRESKKIQFPAPKKITVDYQRRQWFLSLPWGHIITDMHLARAFIDWAGFPSVQYLWLSFIGFSYLSEELFSIPVLFSVIVVTTVIVVVDVVVVVVLTVVVAKYISQSIVTVWQILLLPFPSNITQYLWVLKESDDGGHFGQALFLFKPFKKSME